jgi:hypothetical protein
MASEIAAARRDTAAALAVAPVKLCSSGLPPSDPIVHESHDAAQPAGRWRPLATSFSAIFARIGQRIYDWYATKGIWWATSVILHALLISTAILLMGNVVRQELDTGVPVFNGGMSTVISDTAGDLSSFGGGEEIQSDPAESSNTDPLAGDSGSGSMGGAEGAVGGARTSDAAANSGARGDGHGTVISSSGSGAGPAGKGGGGTGFIGSATGLFSDGMALNVAGSGTGRGRRAAAAGVRKAASIGDAVDGITGYIKGRLDREDLLVVWMMDESISMLEDRPAIADKIEPYFRSLEARDKSGDHRLFSAVLGYGFRCEELVQPTQFGSQIPQAMRNCPVDDTGSEQVCSAVQYAIGRYGKNWKNLAIVIWTDESGDDLCLLEDTLKMCKKAHAMVIVVGPTAVFGSDHGTRQWIDKPTGFAFRLPVSRGPESVVSEKVWLPYWHESPLPAWNQWRRDGAQPAEGMPWYGGPNREGLLSGFSPNALTRLALQTGGTYTRLDREEDPRPFNPTKLKRYQPSYESYVEYARSAKSRPLAKANFAAVEIAQKQSIFPPQMAFFMHRSGRYPFQAESTVLPPAEFRKRLVPELKQEVFGCKKVLKSLELVLAPYGEDGMEDEYDRELSPRWRAWYDLNRGRLLAMSVRYREYVLTAQSVMENIDSLKADTNQIVFHPSSKNRAGPEIEAQAFEARRLLNRCRTENAETPWAYMAQWELDHDFGLSVEEIALPPAQSTSSPSSLTPAAAPTFEFPKL